MTREIRLREFLCTQKENAIPMEHIREYTKKKNNIGTSAQEVAILILYIYEMHIFIRDGGE